MASSALPALLGGAPVRPQGPPDWPLADQDVRAALQDVFTAGAWGKYHGGRVEQLEKSLTQLIDVPFALACGSGTFAVELALRAVNVQPGDEVLLAAYDYPGNFLCVHAVGARPVLVGLDPDNWILDATQLEAAFSPATKALIVSHLHGGVADLPEIMAWAEPRQIKVIEDAAQMPGALVRGKSAGSWGDVGILSFGGSKLLSAGRGGALLTRHADVHQRARRVQLRGNLVCPLSELQAAVLLPQLDKLEERNRQRARSVRWLAEQLRDMPGLSLFKNRHAEDQPGYYKVGFQFDAVAFGLTRDRLTTALRAEGIAFDPGFAALHRGRSPARFRAVGTPDQADRAHEGVVILHHPILLGSDADLQEVIVAMRKIHAHAAELAALQ